MVEACEGARDYITKQKIREKLSAQAFITHSLVNTEVSQSYLNPSEGSSYSDPVPIA